MSELYSYMYNFKLRISFLHSDLTLPIALFSNILILYANALTLGGTELM